MNDQSPALTCARLRSLATAGGLFASSLVHLRMADGARLRIVGDEVTAPTEIDGATGKPKLSGPPVLTLTVERVYP